ncbi:MAG: MFS transporter [Alphaproteobacteria bacterium]|nr:MFS transporter [Alphaproteobacteria bacterium]MDE2011594.1 MFS transporter [Alphaproteobacteria bacterium]MDE2071940.1 MFS transporter [Alphaproteobacteria bacterium]MDE2353062.1 MFS transporter [Alphaproteobacteria bacterium]
MSAAPGHRASLAAILSACTAYGIGMGLTLPLLSLVLERMGVTGSMNGLNLATAGLAALVVTPYVPHWIKVLGAAKLLALSLAGSAVCLLVLYEVPSLWLWFPVRFVLSAALNGLFVATEFWINRLADESNRGRYVALYSICLAGSFGVGPLVLQVIGTRGIAPFLAGTGMLILAMVPVLLARKTAPRIEEGEHGSVLSVLRFAPAAFAAAAVFGAIDAGMAGLLPVYAVRLGYSEGHAALAVTAMAGGSILFQYPIGWLADHMARRHLLALCALAGVLGAVVLPFAAYTPALFYLDLFFAGGLVLGIYSVGLTLLGERFKGASLATANAGFVMAYCLGMLVGPAAEGWALDAWDPHGLAVVFGLICLGYLVFLLVPRAAKPLP